MPHPPPSLCCINPDCPQPLQAWGNKFCQHCGAPLQLHGRYLPLTRLGSGGFAVTYVVHDLRSRSEKVLKVLLDSVPKAIELFEQEAQVLASLDHPGVPHVEPGSYFQVQLGNPKRRILPCLVMEKINGQTLEDLLAQHPQGCPEAWVIDWLQQAIEILQVLHDRQIIHRDLKPANLMLRQGSGQLVLIDFGGAKQIRPLLPFAPISSTRLISPGYSPPEQIAGGGIQPASDFYALGRTLIHLLTGHYPAELEDPVTGDLNWRGVVVVNPALADLLDDLMQVDIRQRPMTAVAVQARLTPIAASMSGRAGATVALHPVNRVTEAFQEGMKAGGQVLTQVTIALWRSFFWCLKALLDTLWSSLLAGFGAVLGAGLGYAIVYQTPIGTKLAAVLSQQLTRLLPGLQPTIGSEFLLYALAGWGTAWGITAAGGFSLRRRIWVSALMGIVGYLIGWVGLQITQADGALVGLSLFATIAPALLTLGLGLPKQPLTYAVVTAVGTVPCIALLTFLDAGFTTTVWQLATTAVTSADWISFVAYLGFFGLFGVLLTGCLSLCHYILLPALRLIGWR